MDGAAGVLLHLHGMRRQRRYAGARTEHRTGGGHLEVEELDGRSAKPRRHELYLLRRGLRLCRTARGQYLCALPERQRRGRREIHGQLLARSLDHPGLLQHLGRIEGVVGLLRDRQPVGQCDDMDRQPRRGRRATVRPRRDRAAGGARRLGRSALRRRTGGGRHLVGDNGRFGKTGSGLSDSGPVRLLRHTTERLFQSGRPLACHVRTQTNNRRYA